MVDATVGIDVGGARKGFHAVALCGGAYHSRFTSSDAAALAHWCRSVVRASVIAIDAPCRWSADGRSRLAERALMAERIPCFSSPSRQRAIEHPTDYFGWMLRGEALYQALEPSHPLLTALPTAELPAGALPAGEQRCCFETFPHAITWHLHRALGLPPPQARRKVQERWALLQRLGLDCRELTNIDWIDAALCAVAAQQLAMGGACVGYGEPQTGLIVVPRGHERAPFPTLNPGQVSTSAGSNASATSARHWRV
ncbi:DUF429 domain-containing protein [Cyanobium sp. ATX 6F1]|uniref:DUF429 domain-containing protein n=1 Tax=unclassified Cyanobium TaxID=2627006 RepID=UPI0020CDBE24|nr:DUF429 domain-containing protein [Cyanobium sp. ATX 6F1]